MLRSHIRLSLQFYYQEIIISSQWSQGKSNAALHKLLGNQRTPTWKEDNSSMCCLQEGKGRKIVQYSTLPEFRVSEEHAFLNVVVDHAGPLYVNNVYMESEEMHKCYLALFTCSSIHLELSPDLTGNASASVQETYRQARITCSHELGQWEKFSGLTS